MKFSRRVLVLHVVSHFWNASHPPVSHPIWQVGVVGGRYHEFKPRDRVLAIFPGTTVFYPATVMTALPRMRAYMLRFEDDDAPKPRKTTGACDASTRTFGQVDLQHFNFIQDSYI